jgi:hypothetical protein
LPPFLFSLLLVVCVFLGFLFNCIFAIFKYRWVSCRRLRRQCGYL